MEVSEYERKRQENIAKNKALLRNLALDASVAGLAPRKSRSISTTTSASRSAKRKSIPKVKEEVIPIRKSSRLLGIKADGDTIVLKRQAEDEAALAQAERAKRQRVSGDVFFAAVGPATPYERTFDVQHVKNTTDKELRALRERMSSLTIWEDVEPNRIKITPERIYSMALHPTTDKALVFAADKMGSLGIFDSSQGRDVVKKEQVDDEDDDAAQDDFTPAITSLKPHARTITAIQCSPVDANALYTASYDTTIRKLDLAKGMAIEVYAPSDSSRDQALSGLQIVQSDPYIVYFTTLEGIFGKHDMRTSLGDSSGTELFQLSEKKIGGFSLHPAHPHLLATASLDRTLKLWDLRKMVKTEDGDRLPILLGAHESRLSVSHASFNYAGQVATSSYDDTIKIYDFAAATTLAAGTMLPDSDMQPKARVGHNNQTGRWVTILKPQWQLQPQDGVQRFCIGNMNRFVDIYTSKGEQLAQLGGDGISAVPAVAQFHPTMDWVAGGTASGKLCLWM